MKRKNLKSDNKVFEAMLKEACKDAAEEMFAEYYDVTGVDDFSDEHNKKMEELFKKAEQKDRLMKLSKISKYAACILLVLTISSAVTIMSVESVRNKFFHYFFNKDATYTEIEFGAHEPVYLGNYVINYIPDGYEEVQRGEDYVTFEKDKSRFIISIVTIEAKIRIDTEDAEVKELKIKDYDALYSCKGSGNILVWSDKETCFRIMGNISEQIMIKIAECIE